MVNAEDGHLFIMNAKVLNKFGKPEGVFRDRILLLKAILESVSAPVGYGDILSGTLEFQSCRDRVIDEITKKSIMDMKTTIINLFERRSARFEQVFLQNKIRLFPLD